MREKDETALEESGRLEEEYKNTEARLLEAYLQFGRSVYELAERQVEDINGLTDQLIELRYRLSVLKDDKTCVHCMARNPAESQYCARCGKKLEAELDEEGQHERERQAGAAEETPAAK